MKRKSFILVAVVATILAVAGYLIAIPRKASVATLLIEAAPAERVLAVNGRIRPRLQVEIRPLLVGQLVSLPFDVGDRVTAGTVLARLDDAPEVAAIAEARASVQAQEAVLAQAKRDLDRVEALGQFSSRRQVEEQRLAVIEGARELAQRRASVVQVQEQRERRVLRAPFAGEILDRPVDPGQAVSTESVIYRLADLSRPQVTAEVDEIYAVEVRPGMSAYVTYPGAGGPLKATVSFIEPLVNSETGARDVRLDLLDEPADPPSGLTVTVNVVIDYRERAISIPRAAIVGGGDKAHVLVVTDGGEVGERAITYIDWPAEEVIVTQGLKAGDRILIDPDAARPGDKVRVAG